MSLIIKKALTDEEINQCMNIRFKVFVEGQNVPMQEEGFCRKKSVQRLGLNYRNRTMVIYA